MHFDLAHALFSAVLILAAIMIMQRTGYHVPHKEGGPRWSWPLFIAVFVVMFLINIIWPY